jgi:H+-translocating NAD(P) transhydrogenase subunit alpha
MYDQLLANLAILALPNTLHTPLMSGTNAIHGVVLIGALAVLGRCQHHLQGPLKGWCCQYHARPL